MSKLTYTLSFIKKRCYKTAVIVFTAKNFRFKFDVPLEDVRNKFEEFLYTEEGDFNSLSIANGGCTCITSLPDKIEFRISDPDHDFELEYSLPVEDCREAFEAIDVEIDNESLFDDDE